jgi:hypothetical protein
MPTDIELSAQLKAGTYKGPRQTFQERKVRRTKARAAAATGREQERRDTEEFSVRVHEKAMIQVTREIAIPLDGVITFATWAALVRPKIKGCKVREQTLENGFGGSFGQSLCDRLSLVFDRYGKTRSRLVFVGRQLAAKCYLEVPISKLGLRQSDATNRRYFDE